eukprot:149096_1
MKNAESKPLIDLNSKSKYVKYTFITANNVKHELDTISESFDEESQIEDKNNTCASIGGLICIVVAVIAWVLMSEIIQSSVENSYDKPFFMRFMVNSCYSFLLLPWICVYSFNKRLISNNMTFTHWRTPDKSRQQSRGLITPNNAAILSSVASEHVSSGYHNSGELVINHTPNAFHVFLCLVLINAVGLFSGYIWYLSLSRTVAAINNTIFQSNCVFVLIFSYVLLRERLTTKKMFAALIAISGVALISFSSPSSASSASSLLGIILCLIATMLFAFWEVLFKYFGYLFFRFGYELSDTLLFQAGIGLCNLFVFWPFVMFFNYFQMELFELPTHDQVVNAIVLPCFLDLLFTSALLCGITLCGALFMSIGLILVIPITFFADIVIFEKATTKIINIYSIVGAFFIIIGFVIIQMDHNQVNNSSEKGKKK